MQAQYQPSLSRRSIRLATFDYSSPGYYFVTIAVASGVLPLSEISEHGITRTELGDMVRVSWNELPSRFAHTSTDAFSVQPDHVHGIIEIRASGEAALGDIVRVFKSTSARAINRNLGHRGRSVWQRGYYERVIRNERELETVRAYVQNNWLKTFEQRMNASSRV